MTAAKVTWSALGTSAEVVVADADALRPAQRAVVAELGAIDAACSRFRPDSELMRLNAAAGRTVVVSPLLGEAIDVALDAARASGGAVDPTVGAALIAAGYDKDFATLPLDGAPIVARPAPGWRRVVRDRAANTVRLEPGVELDLGATAKALAADRAARAAAAASGTGVLVSLGGDVAVAGPPPDDGWAVGVSDGHRDQRPAATVLLRGGGLATSSVTQRRWRRGGRAMHHIIDPRTGAPAAPVWRTVSVAAASCVDANTASTAAIVWGAQACRRLAAAGVHARLVSVDGKIVTTGGWLATAATRSQCRFQLSPATAATRSEIRFQLSPATAATRSEIRFQLSPATAATRSEIRFQLSPATAATRSEIRFQLSPD